ncbi:metal ABC transporter permease [Cytobacillus sp. Hm23]
MLIEIFQYEFLRNAFITGMMIGFLAPLLGVFIVVRRQSLIADALSHVTLAGIAASLFVEKKLGVFQGMNPLYMGMGFSVVGSIFIEKLRTVYKHYQELAIPIIHSTGIGLSVVFISLADGFNTDLFMYLFGSVSAVSMSDVWTILVILMFVCLIIFIFYKELFLLSFDEEHATASGLNTKWLHLLFIVMVALAIAASMRIVGILLVSSLMTLPVAASIRISKGFKQTIILSIVFAQLAVFFGLFSAYYLDVAPGGTIVLFAVIELILVLITKRVGRKKK